MCDSLPNKGVQFPNLVDMAQNKDQTIDWRQLLKQKPRELVLSGEKNLKQIEAEDGLNPILYQLTSLNFLEITNVPKLIQIDSNICKLSNLTNLVLQGNKITTVPEELGKLTKLKSLNLSRNEIESLPESLFKDLNCLQTLNLEQNKLSILPDMSKLSSLISLKCGSNQLISFPNSLCDGIHKNTYLSSQSSIPIYEGGAVHLSELDASHNSIEILPRSIQRLVALKSLDLRANQIKHVPIELANCSKLKDLNLKENPIEDRRLYKLIEQCPTKKVLDYLRNNKNTDNSNDKSATDQTNQDDGTDEGDSFNNDEQKNQKRDFTIRIQQNVKDKFLVIASKLVITQRKMVACIIHQVDLSNPKALKKFLAIQTKLHQGVCDNRQKATIATHDLSKILPAAPSYASKAQSQQIDDEPVEIKRAVYFDARVPTKIRLVPLGRANEMSALDLYRLLNEEADQYRKEKKRNTISGIHKYIHLLKGKQLYPVLLDYKDNVLSLPPLTNAEYSKIGPQTTSVFVEVTGTSIPICRTVMNELLLSMVAAVVSNDEDGTTVPMFPNHEMIVEPVIVESVDNHELLVKYPAKIDLQSDNVDVIFE